MKRTCYMRLAGSGRRRLRRPAQPGPAIMPEGLSRTARRNWRRLERELRGTLRPAEGVALAALAEALAQLAATAKVLQREGYTYHSCADGIIREHPVYRIHQRALRAALKLLQQLGLTPLARAKLEGLADSSRPGRHESA